MRRKIEENDCMLIQGLEELRRKDLNIRALEKTQQRLASSLSQLERDIEVLFVWLFVCLFVCLSDVCLFSGELFFDFDLNYKLTYQNFLGFCETLINISSLAR